MRKALPIILVILTAALAAPYAHADYTPFGTYTAECTGFCASDPMVSISETKMTFTAFGDTIVYTALSLEPGNLYGWNIDSDKFAFIDVTTGTLVAPPVSLSVSASNESGLFLPAPAPPTPEPGLITLMLLGLASLFVARRHIGSRISQAS